MKTLLTSIALTLMAISTAFAEPKMNSDLSEFPKWTRVVEAEAHAPIEDQSKGDVAEKWSKFAYKSDKVDYWQTRAETVKRGGGDCEDFAIAMFFDFLDAGVPESEMMVKIVQQRDNGEIHAYLQIGDDVYDRRDELHIISAKKAERLYLPLYGVRREGWFRFIGE